MGVGIILSAVMGVLGMRLFGGEFFKPFLKIPVQPGFVVINKNARGDVHGIDEA